MDTITFGLFHNQESAENAISELSLNGFLIQDISIIMKDQGLSKQTGKTTSAHIAEGLLSGLIEFGLTEEDARICQAKIEEGSVLLGIPTTSTEDTVQEILQKHKASQIRSVNRNKS